MSFPRYPNYKPSGVEWLGEIPEHWGCVRLKDVATHNDEVLDEATEPQCELVYVDISSVDGQAGITRRDRVRFADAPSRARRRVRHGDVIVSTVRTYLRAITCIRYPEQNLIVSTGFVVVRPRPSLHSEYLGYLLTAGFFIEGVIARSVGVSYPAINASEVMAIKVPVPPLREQEAIAALLAEKSTEIDSLISEQERLIELLKEKRQAVISHAVTKGLNPEAPMKPTGVEWLGEVPAHWCVVPLKHLVCMGNGCTPLRDRSDYWGGTVPWLNSSVVNEDPVAPVDQFVTAKALAECSLPLVQPPAILMGITGQGRTRGMVATLEFEATISQHLVYLTPRERLAIGYLGRALEVAYPYLRQDSDSSGSTKGAITVEDLREFKLAVPPLLEQDAIASRARRMAASSDALIAEAERAVALLQERRTALISAAVTGHIDVRGSAENVVA